MQAVSAAVLLLPDEARESLQTLLCFLSDVTASVADNQMTCTNLAVCLAPSLFHLNTLRRDSSSPRYAEKDLGMYVLEYNVCVRIVDGFVVVSK